MSDILESINSYVWGCGTVSLLLLTGLIYTVKLRFVQVKCIPFIISRLRYGKSGRNRGLSQKKTVCMALGASMGTGNITGVASAIALGGAGAVFWMWVSALLGMALVYAENSLSVQYSTDEVRGPMAYLSRGLKAPLLARIFAVFCLCAAFGMGGAVQVSSAADIIAGSSGASRIIIAISAFILICTVTGGGAGRIGSAANILLPLVSASYMIGAAAVLIKFRENIPEAFGDIVRDAFRARSAVGGISGFTVSRALTVGMRRGIFSNEAGLGSSPLIHSAAESDSPEVQANWAMLEVFFDTVICCTLTALVILCVPNANSADTAFESLFGSGSKTFLAAAMSVFAFCTIIGWYYCGELAFRYISPQSNCHVLSVAYALISSLGATAAMRMVWTISDIFNGLMIIPNLAGLLLLIGQVNRPRLIGHTKTKQR